MMFYSDNVTQQQSELNRPIKYYFSRYELPSTNIYTFQRDTQCSSTDCLLMLRCQLYMFQTVTVHLQELLFRCCMCRLWYVLIGPAGTFLPQSINKQSVLLHCVSRWNVYILQKMIHGPSSV